MGQDEAVRVDAVAALIQRAKSEDSSVSRAALSDLLTRLYPRLLAYLRRLTADGPAAEDCCQETMIRIVTHLPRFIPSQGIDPWTSFQAWAFTIASNLYKDHLRRRVRVTPMAEVPESRRRDPADSAPYGPGSGRGLRETAADAETEAMAKMGLRSLAETLAGLPVEQREVFLLKAYYGYSYGDIAAIVGCPEGTAKSRLHHAVRALRERLKGSGTL
ncbi:MAG: sigma-70 family RNA polymerase sigma factor [Bacillota bacterium]